MKRILPIILVLTIFLGAFAPLASAQAQAATTTDAGTLYTPQDNASNHIYGCGSGFSEGSDVLGCFTRFFYYVPFVLGNWAMGLSAEAFDASAKLTLSSTLYTKGVFLQQGWQITRDFANIFFILILLFIALSLVLDIEIGHANPKKMLGMVVVIAVLINFSFFLTEVVIDISNSLALVFYNQVTIVSKLTKTPLEATSENKQLKDSGSAYITEIKPLSIALVRSFTPQVLSDPKFYQKLEHAGDGGLFSTTDTNDPTGKTLVPNEIMIPLLILIGIMFCVVAYSFGVALISLIARLISLWIAIIFAPFAFVSLIIPSAADHIPGFGWKEWVHNLISNAFAAPVYFFFILLISLLAQTSIIPDKVDSLSPGLIIVLVLIQFFIIIGLLLMATKYVKSAAGKIGEYVFKGAEFAGKAVLGTAGLGVGVAAGGAAILGRKYVGFVGKSVAENTERKALAAGEITQRFRDNHAWTATMSDDEIKRSVTFQQRQRRAKAVLKIGRGAANSSFDIRQNAIANMVSDRTGIGFDSFGPLSVASTAGGYNAKTKRDAKKKKDFADSLEGDHARKTSIVQTIEDRDTEISNRERELAAVQQELRLVRGGPTSNDRTRELTAEIALLKSGVVGAHTYTEAEVRTAIDSGLINPTTGAPWTMNDVGTIRGARDIHPVTQQTLTYQQADVDAGALKADGTAVTTQDIDRTLRTRHVGLGGLKRADENVMKSMANSYLHYSMLNSGYDVEGVRSDALGNIRQLGHYHGVSESGRSQLREWNRSFRRVIGSTATGAAIGTAIAGPLVGTIAGALSGLVGQMTREYRISMGHIDASVRGQAASAASLAGDDHFKPSETAPKYKSPASGMFNLFKDLFKATDGHGTKGGDGGHSQGGGGHH